MSDIYTTPDQDQGIFDPGETNSIDWSLIAVKDGKVNARGLHTFLGYDESQYSRWVKSKILDNEYAALTEDYWVFDNHVEKSKGRPTSDFWLSVDFAKKICMMAKTKMGERARDYFVEMEKKAKNQAQKPLSTLDLLKQAVTELEAKEKQVAKLESETVRLSERDLEVKTKKEFKWKKEVIQNDRGRMINYYVNKHFFTGNYAEAHRRAKEAYRQATGISLPESAGLMSMEQKKDYLSWLSTHQGQTNQLAL